MTPKFTACSLWLMAVILNTSPATGDRFCGPGFQLAPNRIDCLLLDSGASSGATYNGRGHNNGAAIGAGLNAAGALIGALGSMAERDRQDERRRQAAQDEANRIETERRQGLCNQGDSIDRSARSHWSGTFYSAAATDFRSAAVYYDACGRSDVGQNARNNATRADELARQQAAREAAAERAEQRRQECTAAYARGYEHHIKANASMLSKDFAAARMSYHSAQKAFSSCANAEALAVTARNLALVDQQENEQKAIEDRRRHAEDERRREEVRQGHCERATANFQLGTRNMNALDAVTAATNYSAAIEAFGLCGDSRNAEVARHNQALAHKLVAVLKEEAGRVAVAQARYGGTAPYTGSNPFVVAEHNRIPETERAVPRLPMSALYGEARKICEGQAEKDTAGWQTCMRQAQAAVIAKFEPDVAGHCRAFSDGNDHINCLNNRYANLIQGRIKIVKSDTEDYSYDDLTSSRSKKVSNERLRENLRRQLSKGQNHQNNTESTTNKVDGTSNRPVGTGGSAIYPGEKRHTGETSTDTRTDKEKEVLEGLPQYTRQGTLDGPGSSISGYTSKNTGR